MSERWLEEKKANMLIAKFKKENEEVSTAEQEALVGLKLPEQYLIFLRKYNGGYTPKTEWSGKCKNDIRAFYGFNVKDKNWDIVHNITYDYVQKLLKRKHCSGAAGPLMTSATVIFRSCPWAGRKSRRIFRK